jgi:hypothetical protein
VFRAIELFGDPFAIPAENGIGLARRALAAAFCAPNGYVVRAIPRLRRQRQRSIAAPLTPEVPSDLPEPDPSHNLREQRKKKKQSGFEYDWLSINKNLID